MALTRGSRLGIYEIGALIGEGGMGQVYQATDTRLKRQVAIKILPSLLAADPERLARFQREAEVLASLNHPHIAIIYGLEDADNVKALVMELVEGVDLFQKLAGFRAKGTGLPLDESLRIAKQIAEALEAAHEQGIIHRDLKPANVQVRSDGTVKVLDFGLAKALAPAGAADTGAVLTHSPTVTSPAMTQAGVILGTAAYLSPEQARGQPVDKRTDIWAFGCVLFEMLACRAPFARPTVPDSMAAILEREPDWALLPPSTPAPVQRLIARCLVKDRRQRLHDIGDARLEIDEALASPSGVISSPADKPAASRWLIFALAASVVIALAMGSVLGRRSAPPSGASFPARFTIAAPSGYQLDINRSPVAVSRDGRMIAFVATRGNLQRIYVRDIDKLDATPVPGTEGGFAPFFSPDGQWVGFFANQKLRKVLQTGGAPIALADFSGLAGLTSVAGSWDTQDTIFFTPDVTKGIWSVPAAGGPPTIVTKAAAGESFHIWPQLLPGGKAILFSAVGGPEPSAYVQVLATGERKFLVRGFGTRYVPTGHLVFVQAGSLMAVPFDLSRLEITGSPIGVVSGVSDPLRLRTMAIGFNSLFDVSPAGTLAFVSSGRPPRHALVWVDRSGHEQLVGASGGTYAQPRLSPDSRHIAVVVRGDDRDDVWLYDLARNTWDRFTAEGNNGFPLWTPDGTRLTYNRDLNGSVEMDWKRLDGRGAGETIVRSEPGTRAFPFSWSPDGVLTFVYLRPSQHIYIMTPGKSSTPTPFLPASSFVEGAPAFAPDGRAIAYISNQTGRNEIFVQPFPGPGPKLTITSEGANEPVWPAHGRELFYRNGDAIMAVEVSTTPALKVGTPRKLFEKHYESSLALYANYSVTPDGQRFVMVKRIDEGESPAQINVVLNWFDELKALSAGATASR